ncbi:MAG: ATP synthase F1 subunit gamma [Opitutales bacterium]
MKGIREIKQRIRAVKNTAKITRAMQLVAASKMKRAQDTAERGRDYALLLAELLGSLVEKVGEVSHPLVDRRLIKRRGLLLVSTERGLCGALNANLNRLVANDVPKEAAFVSIGRKGTQFLTRSRRELLADFSVSDQPSFAQVRPAVEYLLKAYQEERIDSIDVAYTRYINTLRQEPVIVPLVPLFDLNEHLEELVRRLGVDDPAALAIDDTRDMIFEPDPKTLLAELPALFIKQEVYQFVLEAKASEHSARMVAMKSATDNAKGLIDDLTLEYNKARQAAITQEILEISAAAQFN